MIFGDKRRRSLHWAEAFGASALVHLGAAIFLFDLLDGFDPLGRDRTDEPEITISTIILEGELAALEPQPESNLPLVETPPEPEPDTPDLVEPEPEPAPEPEEPEEPEPAPEPEPEIAGTPDLEPQVLAPAAPDTATVAQPLSPLRPQDGAAVPVAPVATAAPRGVTTLAPVPTTSLQPRQTTTAPPPPQRAAQAPVPDGPAAGSAVSELVARIRTRLSEPCLLALPQEGADGAPALSMIAADELAMQGFASAVLADLTPLPAQSTTLVDNRQCAALNFVRESTAYPAFRLSISLDETVIDSNTHLTGSIGNTAGRYILLLMVDDNGVVQDLTQYLSFTGNAARFEVPLRRAGPARDTSQALIAMATSGRPAALDAQNGQLADVFFDAMRAELSPQTPLVIVPFNVR